MSEHLGAATFARKALTAISSADTNDTLAETYGRDTSLGAGFASAAKECREWASAYALVSLSLSTTGVLDGRPGRGR